MELLLVVLLTAAGRVEGLQGLRALRQAISENALTAAGPGASLKEQLKCRLQLNSPCHPYIRFYLYPRGRLKQELDLYERSPPSGYDPRDDLKVIIHGYSSMKLIDNIVQGRYTINSRCAKYDRVRRGGEFSCLPSGISFYDDCHAESWTRYLSRGRDNVLVVDWERLSQKPCYLSAKMNTWQVSRCVSEAVRALSPRGQLHLVGFSLGAHVAGLTSAFLAKYHRITVHRITGLDPALPLYATPWENRKLDWSDARFVDVIHTDPGIYGKAEPTGHVDFYVNGVTIQPGCYNVSNPPLCSHQRATEVFAESISSDVGFWGERCPLSFLRRLTSSLGFCRGLPARALMGEHTQHNSRGIYFVRTSTSPPYALGWT